MLEQMLAHRRGQPAAMMNSLPVSSTRSSSDYDMAFTRWWFIPRPGAGPAVGTARAHGAQPFHTGFSLETMVHEYEVLREWSGLSIRVMLEHRLRAAGTDVQPHIVNVALADLMADARDIAAPKRKTRMCRFDWKRPTW